MCISSKKLVIKRFDSHGDLWAIPQWWKSHRNIQGLELKLQDLDKNYRYENHRHKICVISMIGQ